MKTGKKIKNVLTIAVVAVVGMVLGMCSVSQAATNYSWTGAESGVWTNAANWDVNGVPPGSPTVVNLPVSGDLITFNAVASSYPLPTTDIPPLGRAQTPVFDLLYGGATSNITFDGTALYYGNAWTTTVGDGDLGNGLVTLNYSAMYNLKLLLAATKLSACDVRAHIL